MSNHPETDRRIVEQRGGETWIFLQESRWNRWFDGVIQSMILIVWGGVLIFVVSHLLAAIGWRTAPFGIPIEPPPVWAALILLLFAAALTSLIVPMISSFVRMLFGRDQIVLRPGEIRVRRSAGPFGRERVFTPDRIEWMVTRQRKGALCISVASKEFVIASLGTRSDRRFIAASLRERYGLKTPTELAYGAAPAGWELEQPSDGFLSFRDPGIDRSFIGCAGAVSIVFWLIVAASFAPRWFEREALKLTVGDGVRITMAICISVMAWWAVRRSRVLRVRRNELVIESKFGPWKRRHSISNGRLLISFVTTKKSDDVFTLEAAEGGTSTILFERWNDGSQVVTLGRALARHTGWNLEIAPQALQA